MYKLCHLLLLETLFTMLQKKVEEKHIEQLQIHSVQYYGEKYTAYIL